MSSGDQGSWACRFAHLRFFMKFYPHREMPFENPMFYTQILITSGPVGPSMSEFVLRLVLPFSTMPLHA